MPVDIEMEPEKECAEYDEEIRINVKSSRGTKGRNVNPFYAGERAKIQNRGDSPGGRHP
jgi:hypothetical protein